MYRNLPQSFLIAAILAGALSAQPRLIKGPIQDTQRARMTGHVHPMAKAENDLGPLDPSVTLPAPSTLTVSGFKMTSRTGHPVKSATAPFASSVRTRIVFTPGNRPETVAVHCPTPIAAGSDKFIQVPSPVGVSRRNCSAENIPPPLTLPRTLNVSEVTLAPATGAAIVSAETGAGGAVMITQ